MTQNEIYADDRKFRLQMSLHIAGLLFVISAFSVR